MTVVLRRSNDNLAQAVKRSTSHDVSDSTAASHSSKSASSMRLEAANAAKDGRWRKTGCETRKIGKRGPVRVRGASARTNAIS